MHEDFYLARYLQARNWDIPKAKDMFIAAMTWRKEKVLLSCYRLTLPGHTKYLQKS
jgi:hypothetical protein